MKRTIKGGIYLVVDPAPGLGAVLPKVLQALDGGVDVVQFWNHWVPGQDKRQLIEAICEAAHAKAVPVIINEAWEILPSTHLDGVHFDALPADLPAIRQTVGRPFICGITCGNDLSRVTWAEENGLDYISFCSLFTSPSAGACEIVKKETVQQARQLTALPIFLAGGITLDNLDELAHTGLNGIALISAIMKADDPCAASLAFKNKLKSVNHETITN